MQAIGDTVGEGGSNHASDVALVQAILVKTTRPAAPGRASGPYLASYDGAYGPRTRDAIRAFQQDRVFVSPAGNASLANPRATVDVIRPGDATWERLCADVAPEFANLRVLPAGRIVYVEATAEALQARVTAVATMTFAPAFAIRVRRCIERIHELHGIAVGVCPQGDRRTFQAQYALFVGGTDVTHAGPGESNHNYGMAVDLGFAGLGWLHADGAPDTNETPWLHHLTAHRPAEAARFWDALRAVGTSGVIGAFRGPVDDRPHLQGWSDTQVSMTARLAAHLAASGTMRWSVAAGSVYRCDLGFGGPLVPVGTAAQLWNTSGTLTAAALTQARNAAAVAAGRPVPAAPATADDVAEMNRALRAQFDLAESRWTAWTPQ